MLHEETPVVPLSNTHLPQSGKALSASDERSFPLCVHVGQSVKERGNAMLCWCVCGGPGIGGGSRGAPRGLLNHRGIVTVPTGSRPFLLISLSGSVTLFIGGKLQDWSDMNSKYYFHLIFYSTFIIWAVKFRFICWEDKWTEGHRPFTSRQICTFPIGRPLQSSLSKSRSITRRAHQIHFPECSFFN